MRREEIKRMMDEVRATLGIKDKIKLEIRPMKTKAASISLDKGVLRINRNLLPYLDEDAIHYLILHELLHCKRNSIYHGNGFYEEIEKYTERDRIKRAEDRIIQGLLILNGKRSKKEWD